MSTERNYTTPRRAMLSQMIPIERAIRDCVARVEALGAHPLLTDAVVKLAEAQRAVADWYDEHADADGILRAQK